MKKISNCLNQNLLTYYQTTVEVDYINKILHNHLPEQLKSHCRASAFVKGVLSITVPNANISYQLKFLLPSLRDALRNKAKLYQLAMIKIKIDNTHQQLSGDEPLSAPPQKKAKNLDEALEHLESTLSKKGII